MNTKRQYLSRFKKTIPKSLPQKSLVVQQMEQTVDDYLETGGEITLEGMIQNLGAPEEVAAAYLEHQASDELRFFRRKHMAVVVMIVVMFFALSLTGVVYVYEYWPTTTVYETAVEIYGNMP